MSKPSLVTSTVEVAPAPVWRAVRMHLHGPTSLFGDQSTNVNLVTYSAQSQPEGLFLINPRDPSKGQLITWAGIKTVLYER